jgi:hypothetical protein
VLVWLAVAIALGTTREAWGDAVTGLSHVGRRWRGWRKVANQEPMVTFWLIGTLGVVVLSVLRLTLIVLAKLVRAI